MEVRIRRFEDTEHLKDFEEYAADTEGNIWSFKGKKPRILATSWKKKGYDYKMVFLRNKYGNSRTFLVHRLVALAFIPTADITLTIRHINGNLADNRLENLEWTGSHNAVPGKKEKKVKYMGFTLDQEMSDKIQKVHFASIRKGMSTVDAHSFMNKIFNSALNDYIKQYGLHKVMQ